MEEQALRFKKSERLRELLMGVFLILILLIIQLPITPTPNKTVIYVTAVIMGLLTFAWHKIKLPMSPMNKSYIESLTSLIAIAVVVNVTGGVTSHFNFLYLLPNLGVSTSLTKWYVFAFWVFTASLILSEALIFPKEQAFNFALLNIWAIGLVTFYGRLLAKEVGSAQGALTEATIEKEKAVNKLKDEFVFVISHELRGPVTAIRGYLELFINERDKISAPVRELASSAFKQSEKLNNLILQLLDLSRLETDKFKLNNERFDLNKFLQEIAETVKTEASEKKINLSVKPYKTPVVVFADTERVKEILLNLVGNAFKYTGEFGQVSIWVDVKTDQAFVSVADTGMGISPEEQPHIFSRFYKSVEDTSKGQDVRKSKKIGLGLYLTRQLLEKMNGTISVESRLGKGSKFTFTLPLAKTQQ
jgi:signal transduction histidine kinase